MHNGIVAGWVYLFYVECTKKAILFNVENQIGRYNA